MLKGMLAAFGALAVIGFAVAVAPAAAQTGGDSMSTPMATSTMATSTMATSTVASFAIKPRVGYLQSPRGLVRLGSKWYVAGHPTDYIYIFSDTGTYERRIRTTGRLMPGSSIRGLTAIGTDLLAISGGAPRLVRWTPQANASTEATPNWTQALPAPPGGGRYIGQGVAYDGAHVWVAASWPNDGNAAHATKHALLKYNPALSSPLVATYRTSRTVSALTYENGYLYGVGDGDLVRISPSTLSTTNTNDWEVVRRSVEVRSGLAFRNGTAYGFNAAQDEVRKARQPSPERLFSLTPSVGNLNPRGLARLGNKWYVAGHPTDYIYIFSDTGTYERRIRTTGGLMPGSSIRGLTAIGTDLLAISGGAPRLHRWTPQTNDRDEASLVRWVETLPPPPGGGRYTGQGAAYDGTHVWAAASHAGKHVLLKYNPSLSSGGRVATYRTNQEVNALTYKDGYLYGIVGGVDGGDLMRISPAALSTTSANNWEVVRRSVEIRHGLVFRNGTAYGFNAAQDEVRAERRTAATTPTTPTTPANPASPAS